MSMSQFNRWLRDRGIEKHGDRYLLPCEGPVATAAPGAESRTLEVTISTRVRDRHGDILEPLGARIDRFMRNPVVLWAHDYDSHPIGKVQSLVKTASALKARILFADTPFARETFKLYAEGFLRGWSVGFIPEEWEVLTDEDNKFAGYHITAWELLELSAVPVPANPEALTGAIRSGMIRTPELLKALRSAASTNTRTRAVISYRPTEPEPEDAEWNAAEEVSAAGVSDLKAMCAWFDAAKPDAKESYKLPHHRAEGHRVVWSGVAAAMGALLGARGGVDIPDGDRKGVYEHLSKHYKQFEKEPPELKSKTKARPTASTGESAPLLSVWDKALLSEVISALKTCVCALDIFAEDSLTDQDAATIDPEARTPGGGLPRRRKKKEQQLFGFMKEEVEHHDRPEMSVGQLADLIVPALMRGLGEATRRAANGEIRRRLGKLD